MIMTGTQVRLLHKNISVILKKDEKIFKLIFFTNTDALQFNLKCLFYNLI